MTTGAATSARGATNTRSDVNSSLDVEFRHGPAPAARRYKASLAYRANDALELYASAGSGFHSNDARGTTIRVDPASGDAVDRVDPLVPSLGAELGARLFLGNRLQATAAVWGLRLDSELLFVGDAGTTEASRPSRREGVEAGLAWFASERYSANIEAVVHAGAFPRPRPRRRPRAGFDPAGRRRGRHRALRQRLDGERAAQALRPLSADRGRQRRLRRLDAGEPAARAPVGRLGLHLDVLNRSTAATTTSTTSTPRACPAKRTRASRTCTSTPFRRVASGSACATVSRRAPPLAAGRARGDAANAHASIGDPLLRR